MIIYALEIYFHNMQKSHAKREVFNFGLSDDQTV